MALTPEQKAAHEELDAAIRRLLETMGQRKDEPDEPFPVLVDWLVICEGVTYDEDGDSRGWYNTLFRGGQVRRSVALGLLDIGAELLEPTEE